MASPIWSSICAIGRDASLRHVRILEGARGDCRVDTVRPPWPDAARYEHHHFDLGGGACHAGLTVDLAGPGRRGARSRLSCWSTPDAVRISMHASATWRPATTSEHIVRGVGAGTGQGAISSRVFVAAGAQRADSRQSLRNLLLSPRRRDRRRGRNSRSTPTTSSAATARRSARSIRRSSSTCCSRGIDPDAAAQALLTFAFCEDVLGGLPLPRCAPGTRERVVAGALPDRERHPGVRLMAAAAARRAAARRRDASAPTFRSSSRRVHGKRARLSRQRRLHAEAAARDRRRSPLSTRAPRQHPSRRAHAVAGRHRAVRGARANACGAS